VSTDFTYLSHWLACTNCLYRDAEFLEDYSIFKSWKFLLGHFFPYTMCLICICRTGGRSYQRPWWYFLVLLMCAPLLLFVVTSLTFPAIFMLAMLMISVKVRSTSPQWTGECSTRCGSMRCGEADRQEHVTGENIELNILSL